MVRSNKQKNYARYHVSLIVALVVLTGAAILMPARAALTAPLLGAIWSAPVSLGPAINTTFSDQGPAISPDGLSLYVTSNRTTGSLGGPFDMWVAHRSTVSDPWGPLVNLGPGLNTTADEGNPAFSRDGHLLFFQSKRLPGFGGVDIWVARRNNVHDDFDWQPAVNLGPAINSAADDNGPTYFEDDVRGTRELYFGSLRLGGADIYVSEQMPDDSFAPATLVTELSSVLNENRPSIRPDGLEIFFQSNRSGSSGPNDLLVATRTSTLDAWSTPVNVGSPINTALSEQQAYISPDGMTLFFASDRTGGAGVLDIYTSTRTLPIVVSKNISVSANDSCVANISPSDVDDGSFDSVNGGALTLSLDPAGPFSLGPHTVRLVAQDDRGVTNSAIAIVTVVDDTAPLISDANVDRRILGPPNHKMVDVTVNYTATDNCGAVNSTLSITSNEPVNGIGDSNTNPDWEIVDAHHVQLRAERSGQGNGRIYTITITATDSNGNSSSQLVTVSVPHD